MRFVIGMIVLIVAALAGSAPNLACRESPDAIESGFRGLCGRQRVAQGPAAGENEAGGDVSPEKPARAHAANGADMDLGQAKEEVGSATHVTRIADGDAPRLGIGMPGDATDSVPASRCWIDYADGYGPADDGTSVESVRLIRSKTGVSGLSDGAAVADVVWYHTSDRIDFGSATFTFRYLDSEITGLNESELTLFKAKSLSGPWTRVKEQTVDATVNEISGRFDQYECSEMFGTPGWYFAILADSMWKQFFPGASLVDADVTFLGEETPGGFGWSMAIIGDLDGDAKDDAIISAPFTKVDEMEAAGKVYVILGQDAETGWDFDPSESAASFVGENADDRAGFSVAAAGDVNGDGLPDFLIGAPRYDQDQLEDRGKTYLILGDADPGTAWGSNRSLVNADASFIGENAFDRSGLSLAGAGNVNNDQNGSYALDDILIGASGYDNGTNEDAGKAYLILGKTTSWSTNVVLSDTNVDASFLGKNSSDKFGARVVGVGDVDADGYDDFAIGATGYDGVEVRDVGNVYLILGRATNDWSTGIELDDVAFSGWCSYVGRFTQNGYGRVIAGIGDFNNDGYADFAIGEPQYSYGDESEIGAIYAILGMERSDPQWWGPDFAIGGLGNTAPGFRLYGENNTDMAGRSVAGVGDINADGYDDFAFGAPLYDNGMCSDAGKVYLILGGGSLPPNLKGVPSFVGECGLANAGMCVGGGGDMTADGYTDFLIGAPLHLGPRSKGIGRPYRIDGRGFSLPTGTSGLPAKPGDF